MHTELKKFIRSLGLHPYSKMRQFIDCILKIESNPNYFCTVQDLVKQKAYEYVSPSIEQILGYPYANCLGDLGAIFISSIIPADLMPGVYETQIRSMKLAKEPGFDHRAPQFTEFNSGLLHANGNVLKIKTIYVILDYTPTSELRLALGVFQNVSEYNLAEIKVALTDIIPVLKRIKALYIDLFPEKFLNFKTPVVSVIKLYNPMQVNGLPTLTCKETEVLKLIASGLSTKEISGLQSISFNTAETHRKHLLEKFEAKNTAELIKKASKVFWLE